MDKRFSNPSWLDITHNLQNEIEVKYLLSLLHHSMTKILSRRLDNQVFGPLNSVLCRRNSWALVARDKHWGTGHLGDSAHLKRQGTYNEENITSNSHPWTSNVRNLNNEKTSAQYQCVPGLSSGGEGPGDEASHFRDRVDRQPTRLLTLTALYLPLGASG